MHKRKYNKSLTQLFGLKINTAGFVKDSPTELHLPKFNGAFFRLLLIRPFYLYLLLYPLIYLK